MTDRPATGRPLTATGKQRGGVTGKGFLPGRSGNPGGRSKGLAYSVRNLVAEALADPEILKLALQRVKDNLANGKTVIPVLEFAAKLNRELPPPQQAQLDLEGEGEVTIRLTWGDSL
jgi:hypothetical protein